MILVHKFLFEYRYSLLFNKLILKHILKMNLKNVHIFLNKIKLILLTFVLLTQKLCILHLTSNF